MNPSRRARGFTLIEVVITITLMVIIMLIAAPLGADWLFSAQTREARSKLEQGFGTAKALATRNPCSAPNALGSASAELQAASDSGIVTLSVVLPGNSASCSFLASSPNPQWSAQLPSGVSTTLNTAAVSAGAPTVIALDNRGTAASGVTFKLSKGSTGNDEEGTLH